MQQARRSEFLEGDIRLAQRFAGLNKQQLDLQQEQIDFNRKMLPWQIGIQSAHALSLAVKAGGDVYNAIDNYSKQKEIKLGEEYRNADQNQAAYELYHGIKPEITYNEETGGYEALTPERKAIRDKFLQRVKDEMSGMKWGNAGRAEEMINRMYSDLNTASANMLGTEALNLFQQEFQSNRKDGIQAAIGGDWEFYNSTMEAAKGMYPDHIVEQWKAGDIKEIHLGQTKNEAVSIGRGNGLDDARKYLEEQGWGEDQIRNAMPDIQQAVSQYSNETVERGSDIFNQVIGNGGTTAAARRAALELKGDNSGVNEALERAINNQQFNRNREWFNNEIGDIGSKSLPELREIARQLTAREDDYEGVREQYTDQHARLHREIEQRQAQAERSERERASGREISADQLVDSLYERWASRTEGYEDGLEVARDIMNTSASLERRVSTVNRIMSADRRMGAEGASVFAALTTFYTDLYSDRNGHLTADGERRMNEALRLLRINDARGATPAENRALLDDLRLTASKNLVRESWRPNDRLSRDDLNELFRMANNGSLDKFRSPTFDTWGNQHTAEISGTAATVRMMITQAAPSVEETLRATGINLVGQGYNATRENGDTMEIPVWYLSNGDTVRVRETVSGGFGRHDKAVLEVKDGDTWRPFDETAARSEGMTQFETNLSGEVRNNISAAFTQADTYNPRNRGVNPDSIVAGLRRNLERALGSEANTDQGKAYIDILVRRYREGRPGL